MESFRQIKNNNVDLISNNDPLDKNRLLIEDLWESVLREECPDDQAERLIQLKELSYSKQIDSNSSKTFKNEIVDIVNSMDLAESIAAARAFSLYFQLVNILEQRVEEDRYIQSFTNKDVQKSPDNLDPFAPALARQNAPVTLRELFYRLRKLNVPPGKLEELLQEMDIRLVFTAHPTEIVRHTIRHKQTRVANLLKKIQVEQFLTKEEKNSLKTQLKEEVRLWWRTDELHQFKPSVLDEVDYALHYFQQVLFNAMPQLRGRIAEALTEKELRLSLERLKPDIVHASLTLSPLDFRLPELCNEINVPLVGTFHPPFDAKNRNLTASTQQLTYQLYAPSLAKFDKIIIFSEPQKNVLEKLGVPKEKQIIIPNGVDENIWKPFCEKNKKYDQVKKQTWK